MINTKPQSVKMAGNVDRRTYPASAAIGQGDGDMPLRAHARIRLVACGHSPASSGSRWSYRSPVHWQSKSRDERVDSYQRNCLSTIIYSRADDT